jgi:hypothetical protein
VLTTFSALLFRSLFSPALRMSRSVDFGSLNVLGSCSMGVSGVSSTDVDTDGLVLGLDMMSFSTTEGDSVASRPGRVWAEWLTTVGTGVASLAGRPEAERPGVGVGVAPVAGRPKAEGPEEEEEGVDMVEVEGERAGRE